MYSCGQHGSGIMPFEVCIQIFSLGKTQLHALVSLRCLQVELLKGLDRDITRDKLNE